MRRSQVIRRGPIDYAIWGAVVGAVLGLALVPDYIRDRVVRAIAGVGVPDYFELLREAGGIGVYMVLGGFIGLIKGLLAVRSGSGDSLEETFPLGSWRGRRA
jgi:hypothetical protein